jgi:hypothetical protein
MRAADYCIYSCKEERWDFFKSTIVINNIFYYYYNTVLFIR